MKVIKSLGLATVVAGALMGAQHLMKQTLAPHESNTNDAPPPIISEPPPLHKHSIDIDSAEEKLRVVVMTNKLQQPWSIAFLPDGAMLVTERAGKLQSLRQHPR